MSCPFYGMHDCKAISVLVDQLGNECALRPAYAPCAMELAGKPPDLPTCHVAQEHADDAQAIRTAYIVIKRSPPGRYTFADWEAHHAKDAA